MADNTQTTTISFGWTSLLGVIFIIAKVFGINPVAHWSWLWVLSPFWIPLALLVGFLGVIGIIALIAYLASK